MRDGRPAGWRGGLGWLMCIIATLVVVPSARGQSMVGHTFGIGYPFYALRADLACAEIDVAPEAVVEATATSPFVLPRRLLPR